MSSLTDDFDLPARLARRLKMTLPGEAAQAKFQPELGHGRHFHEPPPWARMAAVLLLLYPGPDGWRLPLALRPAHLSKHAGQIALPGGSVEAGESAPSAALRETEEELGVPAGSISLLGPLSHLYLYVTDFDIRPWVGFVSERPEFVPEPGEVQELIEAPLAWLLDDSYQTTLSIERGKLRFTAPGIQLGSHVVWGATAMILAEFLQIVDEVAGHESPWLPGASRTKQRQR